MPRRCELGDAPRCDGTVGGVGWSEGGALFPLRPNGNGDRLAGSLYPLQPKETAPAEVQGSAQRILPKGALSSSDEERRFLTLKTSDSLVAGPGGEVTPFVISFSSPPAFSTAIYQSRSLADIPSWVTRADFGLVPQSSTWTPRGLYTLIAEGRSGLKTTLSFKLSTLASNIHDSTSRLDETTGLYRGRIVVNTTASEGLERLERLNPVDFSVLDRSGSPVEVTPSSSSWVGDLISVHFLASDLEGSSSLFGTGYLRTGEWGESSIYFNPFASTANFTGATRGPGGALAEGRFSSDILNPISHILPGAQLRVGRLEDPVSHEFSTFTILPMISFLVGTASGPAVDTLKLARVDARLVMSDSPDLAGAETITLVAGEVFAQNAGSTDIRLIEPVPEARRIIVKRFLRLEAEITHYPPDGVLRHACRQFNPAGTICLQGEGVKAAVQSVGQPLYGITHQFGDSPQVFRAAANDPSPQTLNLGGSVSLSEVSTDRWTQFFLGLRSARAEPQYQGLPPGTVFDLSVSSPAPPPMRFNFDHHLFPANADQLGLLKIFRLDERGFQLGDDLPYTLAAATASFQISGSGRYMLAHPVYSKPVRIFLHGLEVISGVPTITARTASTDEIGVRNALDRMLAAGKALASKLFYLSGSFLEPVAVKIYYDQGLAPSGRSPRAYQFNTSGVAEPVADPYDNANLGFAAGTVDRFTSYFGVFIDTPPVFVDRLPPATELSFNGPASTAASGGFRISTHTEVLLLARDFNEEGLAISGVRGTFYLLDTVFVDTAATPGMEVFSSFLLSSGTHRLVYYSVDRAGNYESPKSAQIEVVASTGSGGPGGGEPPPTSTATVPGRGLAISADAQGGLWMVVQDTASISLAKFTSTGSFEGSVSLPGAGDFGAWRVGFDQDGNALAVGSTMGQTTGPDVAVYQIGPEGSILSTAAFDAGLGNADIAMDATGGIWIAGAVGTGGQSEADLQARMALWKYTPQDGLKLKSLYVGPGGLDAGFGVRTDSSGNIWIVGFSSNPATPGPNKLDLALWKYEATGSSLTAGPFRKPGYARTIGETTNAKLAIENGAIYLAAGKLNGAGNMDLAVSKQDLSGVEIWTRSWHSDPVGDEVPASILSSAQGLSMAGGIVTGSSNTLAVWRYSLDGALLAAETASGVAKANDAALNAEGTWLAVDGRGSPYKFTGGTALPGSGDGQVPADTLPPRTTLAVGEPKSGTDPITITTFTSLSFSAVDDRSQVGDGLGSGLRETLYLIDVDPQSCDGVAQSTTAPRGSCANPVYSSTFTLAAGSHTITYLSRDNAGNEEAPRQTNFSVNLIFATPSDNLPPRTTLTIGTPKIGTAPLFIATHTALSLSAVDDRTVVGDGLGAGVSQTLYLIDAAPESCAGVAQSTAAPRGTCANPVYASTFTLAAGTHTITFLSKDNGGNEEAPQVKSITVDGTPPVTSALVNGQPAASEILTSTDSISFLAIDAGSGVRETFYKLDAGAASSSTQAFSLAAGTHSLVFFSVDNLDNRETAQSVNLTIVPVDETAPVLVLAPPNGSTGTTARPQILANYSDLGRGIDPASVRLELDGVDVTTQAAVTASSAAFTPSADLSQGTHTATARVRDLAGNDAQALSRFFVDSLPPTTNLKVNGLGNGTGNLVLITTDTISFAAEDSGTGIRETRYSLDGAPEQVFTAAFTLEAGTHTLSYRSQDNAGNLETAKTANASVSGPDTTGPALSMTPPSGSTVTTARPLIRADYSDSGSGVGLSSVRLFLDGADVTGQSVVTTSSAAFMPAADLTQGSHTASALVEDLNGNATASTSTFFIDSIAPATRLWVNGQEAGAGNLVLITSDTISFAAADAGTGVRETRYSLDGGSEQIFTTGLTLADGAHTLSYRSQDNAGNLETPRSVNLTVFTPDSSRPTLALSIPTGSTITSARPGIVAHYSDLGRGIDLSTVRLELDGVNVTTQAAVTASSASFTPSSNLSQGYHVLSVAVADFAGNNSVASTRFFVDSVAPITRILINGIENGTGDLVLKTTDSISFSAQDFGTGVRETRYSLDGAPEQVYSAPFTLAAGTHTLAYLSQDNAGNLETAKVLNASVTGLDTTAPISFLEVGQPKFGTAPLYVSTATRFGLTASEPGIISYAIDAGTFQVYTASFTLGQEGEITISWRATDAAGNTEALRTFSVFVDSSPPNTSLFVNGVLAAGASLNLAPGDQLTLSAADAASGPKEVRYSLNGTSFGVYVGSFTLAPGLHSLRFRGQDNVLNQEQERLISIAVSSPGGDTTPPSLSLSCPGAESGVCSVFKEKFSVRGTVFDENLAWYRLESGTALISSGTANRDGTLGVWDVSGLAGVQELKLTGEDLAGNAATLTRRVFVGEPARLLVITSKKDMGPPQGVAVDNARGVVYVANTNKGEIRLYSPDGAYIKKYEDFRHPRAVAVDEGGNLYIAESGKDRIVKLGPSGNVLWMKGKTGRGPLEFRDPSGIAALGGKVAVSDTRNRRVQILDGDGNFLQEFPIPEGSETLVQDDGDQDDEPENKKGVPVGIALDGQGKVYVADAKNRKGMAFSPSGEKLLAFGGPDLFARPEGIAVSTSGECVFISDRIKDRITKFNGVGERNLTFGSQGNIKKNRGLPVETVFRRPIGLHLDTAGTLWVADRNNDAIQHFGLPGTLAAGTVGALQVAGDDGDDGEEEESAAPAPASLTEFYFRATYAVPNPCKSCGAQGFVVQVGLADSANLECRNMLGRVIYNNAFGAPRMRDVGNGQGAQYTYEQQWPVSGAGTGVYACTVTARKAGNADIRKIIRTAIIR